MFDIHQSVFDDGELDEAAAGEYTGRLIDEFAKSPEGQALRGGDEGVGYWVDLMFHYAFQHLGVHLPDMKRRDLNEILFELFPRKVSTPPEAAPEIVAELRAFWQFLQRQYQLPAAQMLALLDDKAEGRLRDELANPANYGMAKSFFMQGQQAAFDMTTNEGNASFMALYNAALAARQGLPLPPLPDDLFDDEDLEGGAPPSPLSHEQKAKKRKERKTQRQARKRNRRR